MIRPLTLTPRLDGRELVASGRWSPLIHASLAEPSRVRVLSTIFRLIFQLSAGTGRSPYDLTALFGALTVAELRRGVKPDAIQEGTLNAIAESEMRSIG